MSESSYFNIYDKSYYERYVKQALSPLGEAIYKSRWKLITKFIQEGSVLDYGCGPNICNSFAPKTFDTHGYDINPECKCTTIPNKEWKALFMWDSLEHIPNFYPLIKDLNAEYLFIVTPNLEEVTEPVKEWKHYRPGEHIFYFDQYSLEVILDHLGYEIIHIEFEEGKLRNPNRPKDIISIVAKRKESNGTSS